MYRNLRRMSHGLLAIAVMATMMVGEARAQKPVCGSSYVVRGDESLSEIAVKAYRDGNKWTIIYYANQAKIGKNPSVIWDGLKLHIPCLQGEETKFTATRRASQAETKSGQLKLLTGGDFQPFTDRSPTNAKTCPSGAPGSKR
jgi:polar amino acid transport system substrate-binding protein